MVANWIMVAVGVWAMISPWVLGFSSSSVAKWDSLIIGLIAVLVNVWILFGGATEEKTAAESEKAASSENEKLKMQKSKCPASPTNRGEQCKMQN